MNEVCDTAVSFGDFDFRDRYRQFSPCIFTFRTIQQHGDSVIGRDPLRTAPLACSRQPLCNAVFGDVVEQASLYQSIEDPVVSILQHVDHVSIGPTERERLGYGYLHFNYRISLSYHNSEVHSVNSAVERYFIEDTVSKFCWKCLDFVSPADSQ